MSDDYKIYVDASRPATLNDDRPLDRLRDLASGCVGLAAVGA
jgi:hypothetical protein